MLETLRDQLVPALQQRLVLLANHVIAREDAAVQRLRPHAGRRLRIEAQGGPGWLPALPPFGLAVTPAGLLEWNPAADDADLRLTVRADDPTRWLAVAAGSAKPDVSIEGDAAFAADVSWLADNLRWDVEADIAAIVGPVAAHQLGRAARTLAGALRSRFGGAS